jgi:hypothetical protein
MGTKFLVYKTLATVIMLFAGGIGSTSHASIIWTGGKPTIRSESQLLHFKEASDFRNDGARSFQGMRSASSTLRPVNWESPPASPEQLLAEYERRLAKHTFDAVEPLISAEAVFWFNDGSYSGLPAIRLAFEATFAAFPMERYWLEDVQWISMSATSAACIYHFKWIAKTSDGEVTGGGRGTTVIRLESGLWKIVHMHLSQEPN